MQCVRGGNDYAVQIAREQRVQVLRDLRSRVCLSRRPAPARIDIVKSHDLDLLAALQSIEALATDPSEAQEAQPHGPGGLQGWLVKLRAHADPMRSTAFMNPCGLARVSSKPRSSVSSETSWVSKGNGSRRPSMTARTARSIPDT